MRSKESIMKVRLIKALLKTDLRKLARDPVLLVSALLPAVLAVVLRLGVPVLEQVLAEMAFDLAPHHAAIVAGMLVVSVMMAGWIVGFLLLEDRAQQMLPALGVTPLTRRGFLLWRLTLPIVIALLGGFLLVGLGGPSVPDLGRALAAVVLLAAWAPGFALMLAAYADNEVVGLALAKFGGLVSMLPIVTLYIEGPWMWVAGVLPPFWAIQLLGGGSWWLLGGGFGVSGVWLWWMFRRFAARAD
jgi:fluoroquinolone transport system permease protein